MLRTGRVGEATLEAPTRPPGLEALATRRHPRKLRASMTEHCAVCDRPMVRRRHVWICPDCDLIRDSR